MIVKIADIFSVRHLLFADNSLFLKYISQYLWSEIVHFHSRSGNAGYIF